LPVNRKRGAERGDTKASKPAPGEGGKKANRGGRERK